VILICLTLTGNQLIHLNIKFILCFLDFCLKSGLNQFVNESTLDNNILDLVLSNDNLIVSGVNITWPFSSSDHNVIYFYSLLNIIKSTHHESRSVDDFICEG